MNNKDASILESKLKRHKISYSTENGKITIGKPQTDLTFLLGLVVLPILVAIGIFGIMILNSIEFVGANRGKFVTVAIFFLGTGIFNFSRLKGKKMANENFKTLEGKIIKVKNEFGEYVFDSSNIKEFEYSIIQLDDDVFEGHLHLVDTDERKHQILGFDDENEKYVLDDLKWFSQYLIDHIDLKPAQ